MGWLFGATPRCNCTHLRNFQMLMNTRHNGFRNAQTDVAPCAFPAFHGFEAEDSRLIPEEPADRVLILVPQFCYLLWCEMTFERPPGHTTTDIGLMLVVAGAWREFGHGWLRNGTTGWALRSGF